MTASFLQRLLGLAAVALLAGLVALAVTRGDDEPNRAAVPTPAPAPETDDGWYVVRGGARGVASDAERTSCGTLLGAESLGVSHPVLQCGTKVFLEFEGQEVLTTVIDHRISSASRQFDLTPALAAQLGVEGTQELRWRFAVRG